MGFVRWFLAEPRRPRLGREDDWVPAPSHFRSVRGGTMSSNPLSSTGESKANPISWIMVDADAKKLAGATPITGFGRLLRKH
jgi:hypothetical protein